eukprot:m.197968 g.197968  ORF g.197968 m.197968 type:complete len:234 (+) comp15283_c0_seq1:133-834(+)
MGSVELELLHGPLHRDHPFFVGLQDCQRLNVSFERTRDVVWDVDVSPIDLAGTPSKSSVRRVMVLGPAQASCTAVLADDIVKVLQVEPPARDVFENGFRVFDQPDRINADPIAEQVVDKEADSALSDNPAAEDAFNPAVGHPDCVLLHLQPLASKERISELDTILGPNKATLVENDLRANDKVVSKIHEYVLVVGFLANSDKSDVLERMVQPAAPFVTAFSCTSTRPPLRLAC